MQTLEQLRSGELKGGTSLKLSEALTCFPEEIFDLADTLEVLDLSGNHLTELPADFGRLHRLRILFCSDNPFTVLPPVLADCPLLDIAGFKACKIDTIPPKALNGNLRWLILTNNQVQELPKEIGNCPRMQKLMLAGNRLTSLPAELAHCRNLALLRIAGNRLTHLPAWLLSMPRLAWLAFSGNPFCMQLAPQDIDTIHWHHLDILHKLGEGASGTIFEAVHRHNGTEKKVAVKVFKGAITSDGLPADEMDTFIAAGGHPGLVPLMGQVAGHPSGHKGLVMGLIAGHFYNLGMPPSFATCTRDVFKDGATLSLRQLLKIAYTIASVACQLHNRGIMHGDLYAHNILADDKGNTLFGDFGAASLYDRKDAETAAAMERMEVCAFGHLLDDLLTLCNEPGHPAIAPLRTLHEACTAPVVLSRPGFKEILKRVESRK